MSGLQIVYGFRANKPGFAAARLKRRAAYLGLLLIASWALLPAENLATEKKVRPLSHEAVAQVWLGVSEDELYIFRLALRPEGTGHGGYIFNDEPPQLFPIASWEYDGKKIEMTVVSLAETSTDIEKLTGTIVGVAMDVSVAGRGWERKLFLRREADLHGKWEKLRSAMLSEGPAERKRSAR